MIVCLQMVTIAPSIGRLHKLGGDLTAVIRTPYSVRIVRYLNKYGSQSIPAWPEGAFVRTILATMYILRSKPRARSQGLDIVKVLRYDQGKVFYKTSRPRLCRVGACPETAFGSPRLNVWPSIRSTQPRSKNEHPPFITVMAVASPWLDNRVTSVPAETKSWGTVQCLFWRLWQFSRLASPRWVSWEPQRGLPYPYWPTLQLPCLWASQAWPGITSSFSCS